MTAPWIAAHLALWLVVLLCVAVLLGFLRRTLPMLEAMESRLASSLPLSGAPVGAEIPPFEVRDKDGDRVESADLVESPGVFLFLSADCPPCEPLIHELGHFGWEPDEGRLTAILGDSVANRAIEFPSSATVLYQSERAASRAFQSVATPQAFAVASGGVVLDSSIPQSINDLRRLARRIEGGEAAASSQTVEAVRA